MDPTFVWAVASIYYQSYRFGDDAWVTQEIHGHVLQLAADLSTTPPLDFNDALDVIRAGVVSAGTPTHRWAAGRAIVKLFGAHLLDLGNAKVLGLFEALHLPENLVGVDSATRLARELQAEQFLIQHDNGNDIVTCARTLPLSGGQLRIVPDPLTAKLTLNSVVQTQKSLKDVAKALDPQSWPHCSEFFESVYVMEHENFEYPTYSRPPPEGVSEPIGGTWNNPDLVYEKFVLGAGLVTIENVLRINATFDEQARTYDLGYRLDYSWYSNFFTMEGPGGLSVDNGFAKAVDDGSGGTIVTARKILGFKDRGSFSGESLMAMTAGLMDFGMDHMFLQAICCEQPVGEHGDFQVTKGAIEGSNTEDYGDDVDYCRRYVDTWLGFWRECTNKLLDDAATYRAPVGDKRSLQVVNRLTNDAFGWWSDALHLWVDASHRCFDTDKRAVNTNTVAALSFFATNDRKQVKATFATGETDAPSVLLVGYDGKNRSGHLMVQIVGNGRAEVVFNPVIPGKNGPKIIPDGIYHGAVLKADSLEILATVYVLKTALKKAAESTLAQRRKRIDDVR